MINPSLLRSSVLALALLCAGGSFSSAQITFTDISGTANVQNEGTSYGVAVADFDQDGWEDVFVGVQSDRSALYRNNGDLTFTNVAEAAGVHVSRGMIGIWGDVNNDGFPDLFVGTRAPGTTNRLFLNNADGTFTDITVAAGIESDVSVGSAAFGDFDNDGRLDLFVATRQAADLLYQNRFDGSGIPTFADVSGIGSVSGPAEFVAMQVTWIDYNHDGYLDLFCVHDGQQLSRLYRNTRGGFPLFQEVSASARIDSVGAGNSMGVSWGDYNNDGWEDAYVTRIGRAGFYRNNGDGTFTDIAPTSGAERNGMGWGNVFADFDNDGDEDLFVGNTFGFDQNPTLLYENRNASFTEIGGAAGAALRIDVFGVATADFNNDGYADLFVSNNTGTNRLLLNDRARAGNWVKVRLIGAATNRMAVGTRIRVVAGGVQQIRTVSGGGSYCSQVSSVLHLGLGQAARIDTLEVQWPTGEHERLTGLSVNGEYQIRQDMAATAADPAFRAGTDRAFHLGANYPNPFWSETNIPIYVPRPSRIRLEVLDLLGRNVAVLLDETRPTGHQTITFVPPPTLSQGLYFLRLSSGSHVSVRPLFRRPE